MQKTILLNAFTNVVASGLAVCDLNNLLGNTLECINLSLGGGAFTKSMITSIQLKANQKVIFETDGSKLDSLENFKAYTTADATKISINLMEPKAKTPMAFIAGALDLSTASGITNLRLEVQISGATTPTLSGVAEISSAEPVPEEKDIRFLIKRRHRAPQTIGAAGTYALQVPHLDPAGGGSLFQRIAVFSANATAIKLMINGITYFDLTKSELEWMQKKGLRTPQAGLMVLDPLLDGIQSGRLINTTPAAGVNSAQLYVTFSAAETITVETEELLPLNAY